MSDERVRSEEKIESQMIAVETKDLCNKTVKRDERKSTRKRKDVRRLNL